MNEKINLLTEAEIVTIKEQVEVLKINNDFDIVYENHVPSAGVVLLSGKIELIKDGKYQKVTPHHIFGVKEIIHEEPSEYGLRVMANSEIALIGKSMIIKSLQDKKSQLFELLNKLRSL